MVTAVKSALHEADSGRIPLREELWDCVLFCCVLYERYNGLLEKSERSLNNDFVIFGSCFILPGLLPRGEFVSLLQRSVNALLGNGIYMDQEGFWYWNDDFYVDKIWQMRNCTSDSNRTWPKTGVLLMTKN